jgi:hypothetical protein
VRLRVEPNSDGFIYVFDTENDRNPVMIFPDPRLDDADNYVGAHAALDIPSPTRTFTISGDPGVDRLYVLLTSEPIPGIPTEDELVKYCRDFPSGCPWKPQDAQWNAVAKWASEPVRIETTKVSRYTQRDVDADLGSRAIVLSDDDPPPSAIASSTSTQIGVVMFKVDLKHQ